MNDRDRLDVAFAELREFGFATAVGGCCQTCVLAELKRDGPVGCWCFYHDQDAENFDADGNIEQGQRIYLSWGADDEDDLDLLLAPILAAVRAAGLDAVAPTSSAWRISVGHKTLDAHATELPAA